MPSRDELEQDIMILEAELQQERVRVRELERENARLRGERALLDEKATESGVDLSMALAVTPESVAERGELEVMRHGIDADLDALGELRHPSGALLKSEPPESATDIVRANQRERAELQERTARANTLLSRIAALVKLDRWDEGGGEILLGRLQAVTMLHAKLSAALKAHKRELAALPEDDHDPAARARHAGAIAALEKALAMPLERPQDDPTQPRRLVFVVGGHEYAYTAQPDDTVAQVRASVLEVARATGHPTQLAAEQWLVVDERGRPLHVDKKMRDISLPSNRVVITTPAGHGG